MADESVGKPKRGRKLPPISHNVENEGENEPIKKPRKKRTPRPTTDDQNQESPSENIHSPKDGDSSRSAATKKKKKKPVGNSREALMSEGELLSDRTDVSARKKKKKKKAPATPSYGQDNVGLAAELADLEEDVVGDEDEAVDTKWTAAPVMKSEPLNKVFIEKYSGFKSKDKIKLDRKRAEQEVLRQETPAEKPSRDTMYFALGTHTVFRTVCVFLQGLLAGFALWHIVSTWVLSGYGYEDFLKYYYKMALPVACVYYFLFALCTVAVLDRYDLARPTRRLFTRCCTFQSGAIAIVIYFIGIIFTTATTHLDDKIGLYKKDDSLWDNADKARDDINTWKILNLMRGIMAILGWIVIAIRPQTDKLTKNLKTLDDDMFAEDFVRHLDNVVAAD